MFEVKKKNKFSNRQKATTFSKANHVNKSMFFKHHTPSCGGCQILIWRIFKNIYGKRCNFYNNLMSGK